MGKNFKCFSFVVRTLYELIEIRSEYLGSFKNVIDQCPDMVQLLADVNQTLTLFAPNNEAFNQLSSPQKGNILDHCRMFVKSHLTPTLIDTKAMSNNKILATLEPQRTMTCRVTRSVRNLNFNYSSKVTYN